MASEHRDLHHAQRLILCREDRPCPLGAPHLLWGLQCTLGLLGPALGGDLLIQQLRPWGQAPAEPPAVPQGPPQRIHLVLGKADTGPPWDSGAVASAQTPWQVAGVQGDKVQYSVRPSGSF